MATEWHRVTSCRSPQLGDMSAIKWTRSEILLCR